MEPQPGYLLPGPGVGTGAVKLYQTARVLRRTWSRAVTAVAGDIAAGTFYSEPDTLLHSGVVLGAGVVRIFLALHPWSQWQCFYQAANAGDQSEFRAAFSDHGLAVRLCYRFHILWPGLSSLGRAGRSGPGRGQLTGHSETGSRREKLFGHGMGKRSPDLE